MLSLHLRLNDETRGIVKLDALSRMKPTALVVNTSRAELIEEGALVSALNRGRPGMAAVDVFEVEPILQGHLLLRLENAVCTPHIGYVEHDSYELYFRAAFENVVNFIEAGRRTSSTPRRSRCGIERRVPEPAAARGGRRAGARSAAAGAGALVSPVRQLRRSAAASWSSSARSTTSSLARVSVSVAGQLFAVAARMCFGAPLLASWVGGLDRSNLLAAALAWYALGHALCALTPSYLGLLPARAITVLAAAVFTPQAAAAIGVMTRARASRRRDHLHLHRLVARVGDRHSGVGVARRHLRLAHRLLRVAALARLRCGLGLCGRSGAGSGRRGSP